MREVKFRALLTVEDKRWWEYYTTLREPDWLDFQDVEITIKDLQFTGLHDKNGKEIWEGDIVAANHTTNQTIEYEHDRFILKPDNYDLWKVCEYWEVIGNIFSNPELLEAR